MATYRVGGEVDASCTRCKMDLAHTILAMVGSRIARVRCNTCGTDRVYRAPQARARPAASRARTPAAERTVIGFEAQLAALDPASARDYRPAETYSAEQVLRHPTFGLGIVRAVRQDKVDVAFKAAVRTLVHGRSGEPAPRPHFEPPLRPEDTSDVE
jgi:hypothetical protein